jgi:O-antigen/teichoic acid export membrane protein
MLFVASLVFVPRLTWRELFHVRRALSLLRELGFKEYRYLTGYFILVAVLSNLVVFLLGWLCGQHEVAVFGSAFRYYNLLSLALVAVHVVLLPAIQQASDPMLVEQILAQHKRIVPLFACVVLLSASLAGWLIPLIDRGQYPEAIGVFQILAASALISFIFSPHINILLNARDFRFIFYVMLAGVMTSAAAISLLIVDFGTQGAAWGFLLSFGLVNFVVYRRALAFRAMDLLTA